MSDSGKTSVLKPFGERSGPRLVALPSLQTKLDQIAELRDGVRGFARQINTPIQYLDRLSADWRRKGLDPDSPILPCKYRDIYANGTTLLTGFKLWGQHSLLEVDAHLKSSDVRLGLYVTRDANSTIDNGAELVPFEEIHAHSPEQLKDTIETGSGHYWNLQLALLAFSTIELNAKYNPDADHLYSYVTMPCSVIPPFICPEAHRIEAANLAFETRGGFLCGFIDRLGKVRSESPSGRVYSISSPEASPAR